MQETPSNDGHYCDTRNKSSREWRSGWMDFLSRAGGLDDCSGINALMEKEREGLSTTNTSCVSRASWLEKATTGDAAVQQGERPQLRQRIQSGNLRCCLTTQNLQVARICAVCGAFLDWRLTYRQCCAAHC